SWEEVYQWWWPLARDKMKADAAIKQKVQELILQAKTQEEKLKVVYEFCARKIRYVAVEYGQAGYEPHSAQDIFKNKYGDCKDQAILLVTMLKEAGIEAFPVLIPTRQMHNLREDFPSIHFNHCIAAAKLNAEIIFLDPTAETCPLRDLPPDDQGRHVLACSENGYTIMETPLFSAKHNALRQHTKITVHPDEMITAEKSVLTRGVYNQSQRYWFLYTPPQLIEEQLKEAIQNISIGATLERYMIENLDSLDAPVVLKYFFRGPEYFTAAGNLRIMPRLSGFDATLAAKAARVYPLDFGMLHSKETIFEIAIPRELVVQYLPQPVVQTSEWLTYSVEYNQKASTIYCKETIEVLRRQIPREEYQAFKQFAETAAKQGKQHIVLRRVQ
ncbi:MAG: transglutaminase domain-containing protein, partial [Candidatus Omnitrophica bacterium]|nr:transglutaminase domain-containing protein [Candidatus Omnitrophota bacterium]